MVPQTVRAGHLPPRLADPNETRRRPRATPIPNITPKPNITPEPSELATADQLMVRSKDRELDAVRSADLIEDVGEMPLDRVLADREPVGNGFVRLTTYHRTQDLQLTVRQPECGE